VACLGDDEIVVFRVGGPTPGGQVVESSPDGGRIVVRVTDYAAADEDAADFADVCCAVLTQDQQDRVVRWFRVQWDGGAYAECDGVSKGSLAPCRAVPRGSRRIPASARRRWRRCWNSGEYHRRVVVILQEGRP
jgi:hypothetical protein